jgi:hypothetical protein
MKDVARCLLLLLFTSLPSPVWASELFGKISYRGNPLKNAEITVKDKKIKTNEIGYYSVDLDPGSYTLSIKLPDGTTKEAKVDVFPQDTEKNLKLE